MLDAVWWFPTIRCQCNSHSHPKQALPRSSIDRFVCVMHCVICEYLEIIFKPECVKIVCDSDGHGHRNKAYEIIAQQFPHITNSFPLFVAYLWVMSRFIDAIFSQCLWWQFSCFTSSSSSYFGHDYFFVCGESEANTAFQSWQFFVSDIVYGAHKK